jgi:hypothetical protein
MEVNSPFKPKTNNPLQQLEDALVDVSKKLPQLPPGLKEFIVKFGPYLIALSVIFSALALLTSFGVGGLALGYYGYSAYSLSSYYGMVNVATLAAMVILQGLALSGLFKRTRSGWQYMFYANLAGIVGNLLMTSIAGALVGGALSLYITFQVREYYK